MLWPEDVPAKTAIFMGMNDELLPAELIADHFRVEKSKATVMLHPTASHGNYLLDSKQRKQIVEQIHAFLVDSSPPASAKSSCLQDTPRIRVNTLP